MRKLLVTGALAWLLSGCSASEPLNNLSVGQFAGPPQTVTIKIKGYSPQTGMVFQNLFVSNDSVKVKQGQLYLSTSRDSMIDTLKQSLISTFGFTINGPETVVPGFADLVLYQAGINLGEQSLMYCSSNLMASSSNDALIYNDDRLTGSPVTFLGLRDCDKTYMGLNPSLFDYNKDGIPDYVEMQCGMNPLNVGQAFASTAGDNVADIDKCKRHIPIDEDALSQPNQLYAYQYDVQVNPTDGTTDFTISNIPILNGGAENFLAFYITETSTTNGNPGLYTAYAVLKNGYNGKTLEFQYWATSPASYYNQEISVP